MRLPRAGLRLAMLLVAAALVPLVAFGGWALIGLQRSTRASVISNSLEIAALRADDIGRAISADAVLVNALAADLQDAGLDASRQAGVLAGFASRFSQFRELTVLDQSGNVVATTAVARPGATAPTGATTIEGVTIGRITFDAAGPETRFGVPLRRGSQPAGWLVADVSLDEVARIIRQIQVGTNRHGLLIAPDGALIAGDNRERDADALLSHRQLLLDRGTSSAQQYTNADGESLLGVVARVPGLGWPLVIEQPTADAFAAAERLQRQLLLVALAALVLVLAAGLYVGRRFVAPLIALERATQALSDGDFKARVDTAGSDEFARLAASFNTMADRLVKLQDDVKSQERQVMFGRIVAGLFHDISHPIQNIANNARLLLRNDIDVELRSSIQATIERELSTLRRFLDDVLNVARPRPLERFPVDVNATLADVIEAMRAEADRSDITICGRYVPGPAFIDGDRFALGRVYRNLLKNAVQATPPGGRISVDTARIDDQLEIRVSDTGTGIPPDRLVAIFDDFVTTRHRGLGLGLATARRIVEQLGGTIAVSSQLGRGSTFTLRFPATSERLAEAVS